MTSSQLGRPTHPSHWMTLSMAVSRYCAPTQFSGPFALCFHHCSPLHPSPMSFPWHGVFPTSGRLHTVITALDPYDGVLPILSASPPFTYQWTHGLAFFVHLAPPLPSRNIIPVFSGFHMIDRTPVKHSLMLYHNSH